MGLHSIRLNKRLDALRSENVHFDMGETLTAPHYPFGPYVGHVRKLTVTWCLWCPWDIRFPVTYNRPVNIPKNGRKSDDTQSSKFLSFLCQYIRLLCSSSKWASASWSLFCEGICCWWSWLPTGMVLITPDAFLIQTACSPQDHMRERSLLDIGKPSY